MTAPDVTVAVVTYKSERVLPGLLSSLPAALGGAGAWRLVVVDNASGDRTLEVVARHAPAATVVALERNRGYAAGINAALAAVPPGEALLLLNPDVRLAAGSVARLLAAVRVPGVGIAAPRLVDGSGRLCHTLRRRPTLARALGEALLGGRAGRFPSLGEVVLDPASYARAGGADWASGAALLVSRACLDAVGPWDESFFLYSEETDFALRAADAGFAVRFTPDARGIHLGGEAHTSPALWSLLVSNRARLYRRRHGPARAAAFRAALLAGEAARALTGRPTSRAAVRALLGRPPAGSPAR